jgi:hypothetical protein
LFYTYRKYLKAPTKEQKTKGQFYKFDMDGFIRSLPSDQGEYIAMLKETQGMFQYYSAALLRKEHHFSHLSAFNEFIHEREITRPNNPSILLFDEIILAKKNRGFSTASFFAKSSTSFLDDTSDHLWRSAAVPSPTGNFKGEYRSVICRIPAKLDQTLMREPRVIQGVPRVEKGTGRVGRKAVPSMLGISTTGFGR